MIPETGRLDAVFTPDKLRELFPEDRTDLFFDALLGDPREGAYDIRLAYDGHQAGQLHFYFELRQRPGKCLACNLTYGLPNVFARHPIINVQGLVAQIERLMDRNTRCVSWKLGATQEISPRRHRVPLIIDVTE